MAAGMIGERWRWVTVVFLGVCLLIGMARKAFAEEDALMGLESLAGRFEQRILTTDGELVSRSEGSFALLRPHFLRWKVEAPGQQLLLSDGEFLWQYDLDLETLARQPVDPEQMSPLRLLMEPETALAEDYRITRKDGSMVLEPLADEPLFQQVEVIFSKDVPAKLTLIDNLGQTISVELMVDHSATPSPEDFVFEPPSGVEIVTSEG